jgi:hypothetical protein
MAHLNNIQFLLKRKSIASPSLNKPVEVTTVYSKNIINPQTNSAGKRY